MEVGEDGGQLEIYRVERGVVSPNHRRCLEGVWVIDTEGKTEYANRRMAEMLGCTTEEMIGRSAFDFVYEADLANAERNLERRKRGIGELAEFRQRRKDGSEFWVLSSTSPIQDESGETIGVLAMVTDSPRARGGEEIETRNLQRPSRRRITGASGRNSGRL